ncbi:MAG: hypothetical protein U0166_04815 [Acidobacteriota bacterium]
MKLLGFNLHKQLGLATVAIAIAALGGTRAQADAKIEKLNRFTVSQEQEGVRLAASWQIAQHAKGPYVPILIGTVNQGETTAKVDLKNISLVDDEGKVYKAAGYKEVLKRNKDLARDKRLVRDLDFGGLFTGTARLIPSFFYPYEDGVVDPSTELLTMTQMMDLVYFEVPEREGHKYTLVVEGVIDAPAFRLPVHIG